MEQKKLTPTADMKMSKRASLVGAIFLMATSAIGPGFITQTATFTTQLGAAFAFGILASIVIDFVVQLNIWRIVTLILRMPPFPAPAICSPFSSSSAGCSSISVISAAPALA